MNIFDILGPIMVGPSSSHTAGVVRIGNVVSKIIREYPKKVTVFFHGSFAKTYIGHGSDKAIIGGILGYKPDDLKIRDSLKLAEEYGVEFEFKTIELYGVHPNTVVVEAIKHDGKKIVVQAESVGGGNIYVTKINDIEVLFDGQYDTLIISHLDLPGVISLVTNLLSVERINIGNMKVYRSRKGGKAIMIIETDEKLDKSLGETITKLPHILNVTVLQGVS